MYQFDLYGTNMYQKVRFMTHYSTNKCHYVTFIYRKVTMSSLLYKKLDMKKPPKRRLILFLN